MQFFLDTGEIEEIGQALPWGIVDGVTTNPSLIAKSGRSREEVAKEICELIKGPVSVEVVSTEEKEMLMEAESLCQIDPHVVIKLPLTETGIGVCKMLSKKGIKTNVTLCFSSNQALLAAKNGATYISPFVGRLDDIGQDGMGLIQEIRQIYDHYGFPTQILAASLRHPMHVRDAALSGADVGTMPFKVMKAVFKHPLTEIGLTKFLDDYAKSLRCSKDLCGS